MNSYRVALMFRTPRSRQRITRSVSSIRRIRHTRIGFVSNFSAASCVERKNRRPPFIRASVQHSPISLRTSVLS